jgi:transcriptional regulator of acetoin/glycerol metabolism
MVMSTDDDTVRAAQLPEELAFLGAGGRHAPRVSAESATVPDLDAVERDAISAAIARRQGTKELRISKSTLYLKIDRYGLNATLRQARQPDR